MKYMTRDQLLEALGPTARMAPVVFKQKPETRYPILAEPDEKNPEEVIAQIEYFPYSWSNRPRPYAFNVSKSLYDSLPDDPELKAETLMPRPKSERSTILAFREATKKPPASD